MGILFESSFAGLKHGTPAQRWFKPSNPSLSRAADGTIVCDRCVDGHLHIFLLLEETFLGSLRILLRGRLGRAYTRTLTLTLRNKHFCVISTSISGSAIP